MYIYLFSLRDNQLQAGKSNRNFDCSEECAATSPEMAGAGDLANIENIRRDEKNSIVGDTLHMVGTLRDPTVGKINCCCLGRALKKTTFRGHVPYQGWVDPLPLKKKSTFSCTKYSTF